MRYIIIILILLIAIPCFANDGRVCQVKATGELIEYQSGNAPLGTLTQNAIRKGYVADDIEEKYITNAEWDTIKDTWVIQPALDKKAIDDANKATAISKMKTKLGLSDSEWNDLKEALQ